MKKLGFFLLSLATVIATTGLSSDKTITSKKKGSRLSIAQPQSQRIKWESTTFLLAFGLAALAISEYLIFSQVIPGWWRWDQLYHFPHHESSALLLVITGIIALTLSRQGSRKGKASYELFWGGRNGRFLAPLPRKLQRFERLLPFFIAASASVVIIVFFIYYYRHAATTTYGDGMSKLNHARRVFDNPKGQFTLAQLGGVWLPLMSMLILLTVWIDPMYHTGFAGSWISMVCYAVSVILMFFITRNILENYTKNRVALTIGALCASVVGLLDLNFIYFGTTPMAESLLMATMAMCAYSLIKLERNPQSMRWLMIATVFLAISLLTRYETWFMTPIVAFPIMALVFWTKDIRGWELIARLIAHLFLAATVMFSWMLLWELPIFGNPLYFSDSKYSAHDKDVISLNQMKAWGHLPVAFKEYAGAVRLNTPDFVLILGIAGFAIMLLPLLPLLGKSIGKTANALVRRGKKEAWIIFQETTRTKILLAPIYMLGLPTFYIVSLYLGQNAISSEPGKLFNIRYGLTVLPFVSVGFGVLIGTLFTLRVKWLQIPASVMSIGLASVMVAIFLPLWTAPIENTVLLKDLFGQPQQSTFDAAHFLRDNYKGGKVLTELLSPPNDPIEFRSNINSSEFIDEIQPDLWESALADPPAYADWIMVGLQDDTIGKRIASYPNFDSLYQVVFRNEIVTIYHKVNP